MKSKKSVVVLLSVLMAATVAHNQVLANDEIKDTVAKTNSTHRLLTRGAQAEFARFAEKKVGKLAVTNFLAVVNLYDAAPAQLLKADAKTRNTFRQSVQTLNERLAKANGLEAATWLERVNHTASTINFLWNYQPGHFVPEVVENEAVTEGIVQ